MPKKPSSNHRGKIGADGLTPRERAFVRERRADPAALGREIAERAGYMGDHSKLTKRAHDLMKKSAIATAIVMPNPSHDEEIDDGKLKKEIRHKFRAILRSPGSTTADVIKVGDKLLATIEGGYVPVQLKANGTFTLEGFVRAMGGAPEDSHKLPEAVEVSNEEE